MDCLKNNMNKIAFGAILIAATALGICSYFGAKSHFARTCEQIYASHKEMCDGVSTAIARAYKDSTVIINEGAIVSAIREGNEQTRAMLQLQHSEIAEDFSNLMLWAAVLMVVFLVFSIYSMYKTDDLINQGRSSVGEIRGLVSNAKTEISKIEGESAKLTQESLRQIEELRNKANAKLAEFSDDVDKKIDVAEERINAEIAKYNKQVDDKADNVNKQFDEMNRAIVSLLGILQSKSPTDKK